MASRRASGWRWSVGGVLSRRAGGGAGWKELELVIGGCLDRKVGASRRFAHLTVRCAVVAVRSQADSQGGLTVSRIALFYPRLSSRSLIIIITRAHWT
jgi:hypothetical protein